MTILSDTQLAGYAVSAGFPSNVVPTMVAIALDESGGDTNAIHYDSNGTVDRGLWQINSSNNISGNLFDPQTNANAAKTIYSQQGLKAWSTYNSGTYTRYLGRGQSAAQNPNGSGTTATSNPSTVSGGSSFAASVGTATAPGTWARIGEFILGGGLIIFAILRLTGQDTVLLSKAAEMAATA